MGPRLFARLAVLHSSNRFRSDCCCLATRVVPFLLHRNPSKSHANYPPSPARGPGRGPRLALPPPAPHVVPRPFRAPKKHTWGILVKSRNTNPRSGVGVQGEREAHGMTLATRPTSWDARPMPRKNTTVARHLRNLTNDPNRAARGKGNRKRPTRVSRGLAAHAVQTVCPL
jgi:hypothetical protein